MWCLVQTLPKPPQILLLVELSQGRVGTGPYKPGATMELGTGGLVKRGEGVGTPLGQLHPCPLWPQPLHSVGGVTEDPALPQTPKLCVFLPCTPVALISPFPCAGTRIHEGIGGTGARDRSWLEASALPKVCTPNQSSWAGAVVPAPPCSGLLFTPVGPIDRVKNMIFGFAASG